MAVDYKMKYLDLRAKFMKTADRMYRLGKEDGLKEGQMQAQQQQAEMQAQQEAMMNGQPQIDPETGQPIPPEAGGEMPMSPEEQAAMGGEMPEEGMPMEEGQGSELDERIGELESLVAKGEKPKVTDLRKVIIELAELRKNQKQLKPNHKKVVVSKQKDLVDNMLKKWEKEANKESVTENLESIIEAEGINLK